MQGGASLVNAIVVERQSRILVEPKDILMQISIWLIWQLLVDFIYIYICACDSTVIFRISNESNM